MVFSTTSIVAPLTLLLAVVISPEEASASTLRKLEENGFEHNVDPEGQQPLVKNVLDLDDGRHRKNPLRENEIFHELVSGQCVKDHKCATVWGDPHIVTFDDVKYDCMGRGEYVLMKSTKTKFEVQGRFIPGYYHSGDKWGQEKTKKGKGVSVTQALSVDTGRIGAPQFDVFASNPESGKCNINYFIDGQVADFGEDGLGHPGIEYFHQIKVGKTTVDYVFFPDSAIMVTVYVRKGTYGCVLAAKICLPPTMTETEDFVGLMGTPDGDRKNDWMDSDGNTLTKGGTHRIEDRLWKNAFDYCTQNWCVRSPEESIFGYVQGYDWAYHAANGCADGAEYDPETELAVSNPSPACSECCADAHEGIDKIQCLTECEEAATESEGVVQCHIEMEDEETLATVERQCPDPVVTTPPPPGTKGDPHFRTHGGEMYDFHGGCDLVLLDNPEFNDGLGMLIHVRTKIETWWSYVESAAVRIGDQVLEINGGNKEHWLFTNGVANEQVVEKKWYNVKFAGYVLRYKKTGPNREANIYLGNGHKLTMKTYNDFVKVELEGDDNTPYQGSRGLLGRFPDGKRVARDGETFIEDVNAFGQEWQVRPEEPRLFHSYDEEWIVSAGQKCAMPTESMEKKELRARRLANGMSMAEAEQACAHLTDRMDHKACVFDVIATQDTNMASVW